MAARATKRRMAITHHGTCGNRIGKRHLSWSLADMKSLRIFPKSPHKNRMAATIMRHPPKAGFQKVNRRRKQFGMAARILPQDFVCRTPTLCASQTLCAKPRGWLCLKRVGFLSSFEAGLGVLRQFCVRLLNSRMCLWEWQRE